MILVSCWTWTAYQRMGTSLPIQLMSFEVTGISRGAPPPWASHNVSAISAIRPPEVYDWNQTFWSRRVSQVRNSARTVRPATQHVSEGLLRLYHSGAGVAQHKRHYREKSAGHWQGSWKLLWTDSNTNASHPRIHTEHTQVLGQNYWGIKKKERKKTVIWHDWLPELEADVESARIQWWWVHFLLILEQRKGESGHPWIPSGRLPWDLHPHKVHMKKSLPLGF